jgi:hypothetical protein
MSCLLNILTAKEHGFNFVIQVPKTFSMGGTIFVVSRVRVPIDRTIMLKTA